MSFLIDRGGITRGKSRAGSFELGGGSYRTVCTGSSSDAGHRHSRGDVFHPCMQTHLPCLTRLGIQLYC